MQFDILKKGRIFEIREIATDRLIAIDTSYRAALARVRSLYWSL
jgi:hypothetical protein